MTKDQAWSAFLAKAAVFIGFAAAMTALWSFLHQRPEWGAYNLAIVAVSLLTFIATHAESSGL